MNAALWAHPWDLVDEGPAEAAERIAALGIDEVNLATTMHSVQTLNPHNPERKTFFADASAYFQPNEDNYGQITPATNPSMDPDDWLAEIATAFEETPVSLNSWTVPFHSSKLGRRHPDATITSPFGDDLVWGLCPSNPAVREYGLGLVQDLVDRDCFGTIEMELADYQYGTGYGWHHQEFFTRLGPLGEFLFGLCFCDDCQHRAEEAGIDTGAARQAAKRGLSALFEGKLDRDIDVGGWLLEHPEVAAYADNRRDTLDSLFAEFDSVTNSTDFGYYFKMGGLGDERMGVEHSWKHGLDLNRITEHIDEATVLAYHPDETVVRDDVHTTDTLLDVPVRAGILAGHPIIQSRSALVSQVQAAESAGADSLAFYGYGVLPERNLDWISDALSMVS